MTRASRRREGLLRAADSASPGDDRSVPAGAAGRLGYLVKAFPRVSETFIINEVIELERQGFDLRIYSMINPPDPIRHRLVDQVRSRTTYLPNPLWRSLGRVIADHAWLLGRSPRAYLSTAFRVLTSRNLDLIERFGQAPCLARALQRDGVTHLHAGFVHSPGSLAWLVSLMSAMPFSLATHAKDLYHSPPALLRQKLAAAQVVFTCTRANVAHLESLSVGPAPLRVRHAYHGTALDRFQFGPCERSSPPVVLAVARLVEKKGIEDLICACALLRDRRCRFSCHVVGSGQLRESLTQVIRQLDLDGTVTLEGPLDQDEVLAWYRRATVLALPCLVTGDGDRDGIPNVLVEAAACGLPIVTTPVSGIPELIEDGRSGLLVPPREPQALALALEKMLQSAGLRAALRANARAKVEEVFDVRQNARAIGQELCRVMAASQQPRSGMAGSESVPRSTHLTT